MKKFTRIICSMLIFVLVLCVFSVAPVRASEDDSAAAAPTVYTGETAPPSETEDTAEILPTSAEATLSKDASLLSTRATNQNGKYRHHAVIWTDNGEKIEYTYNGKYNKYDHLLMHSLWYEGEWRAAYCIEPGKTVYNSSDYDEVESSGVDPWGQLDYSKQRGVGLALLYGYPNGIDSDNLRTQIAYQLATHLIVHEIILGWRQDVHPFARTNDAYYDAFGGGVPGNKEGLEITSEYYSSVNHVRLVSEDIWYAYNHISNSLATHDLIPSFTAGFANMAPTHTMVSNGDGTYSITLTDTNNILSAYSFTNTEQLTFTKSNDGKSLTITTKGSDVPEAVIVPTRIVPSVENSAFLIWNAETGSQELCTLKGAQDDPVPAYFKLKLPTGKLKIQKETSDGNCLSGWQFEIYSDAACTKLVSGPHITDTTAQILLPNLQPGTYWVKEIGNASTMVNDLYYCQENIKKVTISAGETSTAQFLNIKITTGKLIIKKITSDDMNLSGWQFEVYSDAACTRLVSGPHLTGISGQIVLTEIEQGTYWIKETGNASTMVNDLYYCQENIKKVAISAGETAEAIFMNIKKSRIAIQKETSNGNCLSGWQFEVYSEAACTKKISGPHITDVTGQVILTDIQPGTYWIKETGNANTIINDLYYCEESIQKVTVSTGETTTVKFLNIVIPKGNLAVTKSTDTNTDLTGWRFVLYSDEACSQLVYGPESTDANGIARFENIKAGTYWIMEIGNYNPMLGSYYTCSSRNPQPITIIANDTVNANFYNTLNTGTVVIHKTDANQNTLSGAHFLLEWSKSGSDWNPVESSSIPGIGKTTTPGLKNGILVTDNSGNISFEGLALGVYYRITEVKAPNGFQLSGDYAYEGRLSSKDEVITINVVNTPVFTLPHTGSRSMIGISAGLGLCLLTCIGAVIYLKRKEH